MNIKNLLLYMTLATLFYSSAHGEYEKSHNAVPFCKECNNGNSWQSLSHLADSSALPEQCIANSRKLNPTKNIFENSPHDHYICAKKATKNWNPKALEREKVKLMTDAFNETVSCMGGNPKVIFPIINNEGKFHMNFLTINKDKKGNEKFSAICPAQVIPTAIDHVNKWIKYKKLNPNCGTAPYTGYTIQQLTGRKNRKPQCALAGDLKACFAYATGYYLIAESNVRERLFGEKGGGLFKLLSKDGKKFLSTYKDQLIDYCTGWHYYAGPSIRVNANKKNFNTNPCVLQLKDDLLSLFPSNNRAAKEISKLRSQIRSTLDEFKTEAKLKNNQNPFEATYINDIKVNLESILKDNWKGALQANLMEEELKELHQILYEGKKSIKRKVRNSLGPKKAVDKVFKKIVKNIKNASTNIKTFKGVLKHLDQTLPKILIKECKRKSRKKTVACKKVWRSLLCKVLKSVSKICLSEKSYAYNFSNQELKYCQLEGSEEQNVLNAIRQARTWKGWKKDPHWKMLWKVYQLPPPLPPEQNPQTLLPPEQNPQDNNEAL